MSQSGRWVAAPSRPSFHAMVTDDDLVVALLTLEPPLGTVVASGKSAGPDCRLVCAVSADSAGLLRVVSL